MVLVPKTWMRPLAGVTKRVDLSLVRCYHVPELSHVTCVAIGTAGYPHVKVPRVSWGGVDLGSSKHPSPQTWHQGLQIWGGRESAQFNN